MADHAATDVAANRVERELGPIDLWVNNAFTAAIAFFQDIEPEESERITAASSSSSSTARARPCAA